MSENKDKQKTEVPLDYLEQKYGKEPKLTQDEIDNPSWH